MPQKQGTFTLVPNPLGMQGLLNRGPGGVPARTSSKPPMTTKQASKLYRQQTRQPRLSKTEQRRQELEEQQRIRKEHEKERAANKARILREKKKAKDQAVIEHKKKAGLPLVNVRASQDTISRFLRGNGLGNKRDSDGNAVEGELPTVAEEEEESNHPSEGEDETEANKGAEDEEIGPDAKRLRISEPTAMCKSSQPSQQPEPPELDEPRQEHATGAQPAPSPERDQKPLSTSYDDAEVDDLMLEGMLQTQLLSEAAAAETCASSGVPSQKTAQGVLAGAIPTQPSRKTPEPGPQSLPMRENLLPQKPQPKHPPFKPAAAATNHSAARPALQEASLNLHRNRPASRFSTPYKPAGLSAVPTPAKSRHMPPPAVPAFKQTNSMARPANVTPKFLRKEKLSAAPLRPALPPIVAPKGKTSMPQSDLVLPTSTQLFVLSHIDELFPSPSQEALELAGDDVESNAQMLAPERFGQMQPAARFLCKPAQAIPALLSAPRPIRPPLHVPPAKKADLFAIPFLSTQDLMSSQDERELELETTPCKVIDDTELEARAKAANSLTASAEHALRSSTIAQPPLPDSVIAQSVRPVQASTPTVASTLPAALVLRRSQRQKATQPSSIEEVAATAKEDLPPDDSVLPSNPKEEPNQVIGEAVTVPSSPPKKRFFTSSRRQDFYLALHRSRDTYEADERKREQREQKERERRGKQEPKRLAKEVADVSEGRGRTAEAGRRVEEMGQFDAGESNSTRASPDTATADAVDPGQGHPSDTAVAAAVSATSKRGTLTRSSSRVVVTKASPPVKSNQSDDRLAVPGQLKSASQETDYGGGEWEEDEITLLDEISGMFDEEVWTEYP